MGKYLVQCLAHGMSFKNAGIIVIISVIVMIIILPRKPDIVLILSLIVN